MNRFIGTAFIVLLIAAVAAPPGAGVHCNGTVMQIDIGPETFYLDDRSAQDGLSSQWFYEETNGMEGLQSGGHVDVLQESLEPELHDPCRHLVPDTLLF